MKNTAYIRNDGSAVFLDTTIRPDRVVWFTLILVNLFIWAVFALIVAATLGEDLPRFSLLAIYVLLPVFYGISLGKTTLWNLFGRETVIVTTRSVVCQRHYGLFKTTARVFPFQELNVSVSETETRSKTPCGYVDFSQKAETGLYMTFFTTSVLLPITRLQEFAEQIRFVFTVDHLTDPEFEIIHLN